MEMNQHVSDWIAALRSGDYKQGFSAMMIEQEDGTASFCCLGVACHLADVPFEPVAAEIGSYGVYLDHDPDDIAQSNFLPEWLAELLTLTNLDQMRLTSLNDGSANFETIADRIEEAATRGEPLRRYSGA